LETDLQPWSRGSWERRHLAGSPPSSPLSLAMLRNRPNEVRSGISVGAGFAAVVDSILAHAPEDPARPIVVERLACVIVLRHRDAWRQLGEIGEVRWQSGVVSLLVNLKENRQPMKFVNRSFVEGGRREVYVDAAHRLEPKTVWHSP